MADAAELVDRLRAEDRAADALGLTVEEAARGRVVLTQPVDPQMVNGHGVVHGGVLFTLADTAFAYCCTSLDRPSVTRTADIAFLAPAAPGPLTATATHRASAGRTTICDVAITDAAGTLIAEFRGHGTMTR